MIGIEQARLGVERTEYVKVKDGKFFQYFRPSQEEVEVEIRSTGWQND